MAKSLHYTQRRAASRDCEGAELRTAYDLVQITPLGTADSCRSYAL